MKILRSRWFESTQCFNFLEKTLSSVLKGEEMSKLSPFGLTDQNLLDFRGLNLENKKLFNAKFNDADLSYVSFDSTWIEKSYFNNIRFEQTNFTNIADHGNKFQDCAFLFTKFNLAGIGYKGSIFTNCSFENCNFLKAVFIRAEFTNCKFINCKLRNIDFNASSFENCYFEGKMEEVWFRNGYPLESEISDFGPFRENKMTNVSFENADLIEITFSGGCDLSSVKMPLKGEYYKINQWENRLNQLNQAINDWPDDQQKNVKSFVYAMSVHANKQNWYILSKNDLIKDYGEFIAEKIINFFSLVVQ